MVDIYDYVDFRKYLADWFVAKKEENPRLSHRWFARRMGTTDPSALANVVKGRRSMSAERVEKLIDVLELSEGEAQYLRQLVAFDQASSAEERDRLLAQLRASRGAVRPALDEEHLEVMSSVKYMAVRELARCAGFRGDDPAWVASRFDPPWSVSEAKEVVERLVRLGLLSGSGADWRPAQPDVQTDVTVPLLGSLRYHAEADEMAAAALVGMPSNEEVTSFTGHTLSIPREKLDELRTLLWQAFHQVAITADAYPDPDTVVQVNVRMFPLTKLD